jgi:hypothetical protein
MRQMIEIYFKQQVAFYPVAMSLQQDNTQIHVTYTIHISHTKYTYYTK